LRVAGQARRERMVRARPAATGRVAAGIHRAPRGVSAPGRRVATKRSPEGARRRHARRRCARTRSMGLGSAARVARDAIRIRNRCRATGENRCGTSFQCFVGHHARGAEDPTTQTVSLRHRRPRPGRAGIADIGLAALHGGGAGLVPHRGRRLPGHVVARRFGDHVEQRQPHPGHAFAQRTPHRPAAGRGVLQGRQGSRPPIRGQRRRPSSDRRRHALRRAPRRGRSARHRDPGRGAAGIGQRAWRTQPADHPAAGRQRRAGQRCRRGGDFGFGTAGGRIPELAQRLHLLPRHAAGLGRRGIQSLQRPQDRHRRCLDRRLAGRWQFPLVQCRDVRATAGTGFSGARRTRQGHHRAEATLANTRFAGAPGPPRARKSDGRDLHGTFVTLVNGATARLHPGERVTMIRSFRTTLLAFACSLSLAAHAQTDAQFIYQADQLRGLRTQGVSGSLSTDDALQRLLAGSGFTVHHDASGAMVIVKDDGPRVPPPSSRSTSTSRRAPAADPAAATKLQAVVVTGSRIPRSQVEGPAPITTITAQDISRNGFATVSDVMSSLTQNLGALDNNQSTDGFSPGAQAVDLRGLGPNHTLVLVNGRRIADYPQAYDGNSNFTDISNLPTSLIDRVEILSGSASAIYGSDAMSGVINFILKKKVDGTTIDYRVGDTQHGGGSSQRLQISSGFSKGKFDSVFGLELYETQPIWDYQRSFTDSRLDSPGNPLASHTFVRQDVNGNYIDPGKDTCDSLSHLDQGSVLYTSRPGYAPDNNGGPGYYCGSYKDVGYGTLENGRKSANFFGSATYHVNDHMDLFLDVLAGTSHQDSYNTSLKWLNCEKLNGDCTPTPFYNQATGQIEQWERNYFTLEENGGLKPGEIRNINNTLSLTTGIKGNFGQNDEWNYEASFGHSQNQLKSKWPALIAAKAQALYLGPSLGVDPDSGYQIYNAPPSRLYTPLTVAQFRSNTQDSIDNDESRSEDWSFTLS